MKRNVDLLISLSVFTVLFLVAIITVFQTFPPSPLPENAPAEEFSAERAVEHIRAVAKQPHPTGSSANTAARNYILAVLKGLGLETDTQQYGDLVNVVGRIAGTRSSNAVLLTAHLDSVAQSPGATDDGSGVAVLLETARALVSGERLRNSVMFLFSDFEESGSTGAKAFIAHHPWSRDIRVVIGFDAGGLSGPGTLTATSADNGWLIRQLSQADAYISSSSAINALAYSSTDFGHAFKTAGFSGYEFDLYWDRRIHTPEDNIENINLSSLQHQGYHALSLARYLVNLDSLADPKEPDVIYFSVLRLFTVLYPSNWAFPLAIVVVVVFCSILIFGLKGRILTWGGIGYGAFVVLAGLLLAPLPSLLFRSWIPGVSIRFVGHSLDQPTEVRTTVFLALALIIAWYWLSLRFKRESLPDLTIGALVLMMVGMTMTSIAFPALSFALTWPLLFSLFACANWFYWNARHKNSKTVILSLLFSGAVDIIVLGPTILLGMFDQPSLTLILLGVLCGFLVPNIHLVFGRTLWIQENNNKSDINSI